MLGNREIDEFFASGFWMIKVNGTVPLISVVYTHRVKLQIPIGLENFKGLPANSLDSSSSVGKISGNRDFMEMARKLS